MLQQSTRVLLAPSLLLLTSLLLGSCQSIKHNINQQPFSSDNLFASQNADTLSQRCSEATTNLQEQLNALEERLTDTSELSFLTELDNFYIQLENHYSIAQLYSNTHPNADIRSSASSCQKSIESVLTDANLSQAIYQQLQQIDSSNSDAITQRYHKKLLNNFTRSGVDKDQQLRDTLRQLQIDIADLGQQFSKNIREDVRHITVDNIEALNGLPQDYIDGLSKNAEGQWLITTDYPSIFPFLRYAQDDKKRLAIYKLFLNRGHPNNEVLLKQIISKRDQLAKHLGYATYADYVTEVAMIATPSNASTFIDRIANLAKPRSERDYNQLLAQLQTTDPQAEKVGNWQKAFLEEQVKKEQYQYNAKAVREYFAYDDVKQGIFELAGQLFDVEIIPWQTDVWHPAVSAHELRTTNGRTLGYFYLDMHPREGKYKHAAHFGIKTGVLDKQLPVSALICNFPGEDKQVDSTGQRLNRGLMEHNQVETFLHEFGHLMHSLIGGHQIWSGLSGISTERDFVEAPSQLLEEWVWNYDTLKTFAVNAQGETIPKAMVNKML
ncbi:M3 family metallopeptidase, partial [bacterium]|nr:M3 family metallopeptidase [bacterium]